MTGGGTVALKPVTFATTSTAIMVFSYDPL